MRSLYAVVLVLALQCSVAARAETRVALVIGNSSYEHTTRLANPVNDASLIASILRRQGFDVLAHTDLGFKAMKRAIKTFTGKVEASGQDTVGLVFYAGHGLQSEGVNYLVPVDADIQKEGDIAIEAIDTSSLLAGIRLAGNRLNIVILDACRNNPYEGQFRSSVRGLARMDAPVGSLVAYSTSPGSVATDGDSANSPYTQALASAMMQQDLKIEDVFKRVRQKVFDATGGKQVPWESSSVFGDFYFQRTSASVSNWDDSDGETTRSIELAFWEAVKESDNVELLQSYLDSYPGGAFAPIARALIDQAKQKAAARKVEPETETEATIALPGVFTEGLWQVVRISPSCRKRKAKNAVFQVRILAGKIYWGRGQGSIDKSGTFKLTSKVIEGARAKYTGRLRGNTGSGRFVGENLIVGKSCTGTITMTWISE